MGGVLYVNDSIATAPERTLAGMHAFDERFCVNSHPFHYPCLVNELCIYLISNKGIELGIVPNAGIGRQLFPFAPDYGHLLNWLPQFL